jgi:hypothetical protein
MNLFKQERTDVPVSLQERAIKYLDKYYTREKDITSIIKKPKFYILEPNSINGIAQATLCDLSKNWIDTNNNRYKSLPDAIKPLNGCYVNINYTKLDGKEETITAKPIYFDKELSGKNVKNDLIVWSRRGGEYLSKKFGMNSYISSTSARRVKLGGKKTKTKTKTKRKRT